MGDELCVVPRNAKDAGDEDSQIERSERERESSSGDESVGEKQAKKGWKIQTNSFSTKPSVM